MDMRHGDCRAVLPTLADASVDSIVTDPPYELGFMGKGWDKSGIAYDLDVWRECLRVLKPGGHLLAFGGTRTQHRMVCAIEDAGFGIRDMIAWVYATGFPKSKNLGGDWQGWGTALKPAHEPICVARKPIIGTVAANVLAHGTGALNIDGCRIASPGEKITNHGESGASLPSSFSLGRRVAMQSAGQLLGRWPANFIHDGSDEVAGLLPQAARFFYCAKPSKRDRDEGNKHPTVKPTDLMRYLCRLVTPPGGTVLDPFMGSGSTGKAAQLEGFDFIGIERDADSFTIAQSRVPAAQTRLVA